MSRENRRQVDEFILSQNQMKKKKWDLLKWYSLVSIEK